MFLILIGLFSGILFLEPIIINFIYFSNVDLFFDIILFKNNKEKLINFMRRKICG